MQGAAQAQQGLPEVVRGPLLRQLGPEYCGQGSTPLGAMGFNGEVSEERAHLVGAKGRNRLAIQGNFETTQQ